MSSRAILTCSFSLVLGAAACTAPIDTARNADDPANEPTSSTSEALTGEVGWSNTGAPVRLPMTASQGLCYFSEISGHFGGYGDSIELTTADDGTWQIGGTFGSGFMQGRARCLTSQEMFNSTSPGFVQQFEVSYSVPSCGINACVQPAGENAIQLEPIDGSVCVLTGLQGQFNGYGEGGRVYQGNDGHWWLGADSLSGPGVTARAACMSAPAGSQSTPWLDYSWAQGTAPTWMGFPPSGYCALSGAFGKFRGQGEGVEIQEVWNGSLLQWQLSGFSGQKYVNAQSQCFLSICKGFETC